MRNPLNHVSFLRIIVEDDHYLPAWFCANLISDRGQYGSVAVQEFGSVGIRNIKVICRVLWYLSVRAIIYEMSLKHT